MAFIEKVDALLNRATPVGLEADVAGGQAVPVAIIGEGIDLVYGVFPYPRRAVGVPGRLLTTEVTHQPVLAVREGDKVTPLPYAEDVLDHPLGSVLLGHLQVLSLG